MWLLLLSWAAPGAALAQEADGPVSACDGRIVSEIAIRPHDPSFLSIPKPLRPLARAVGLDHMTSKEEMIDSFVLVEAGEPCRERQRAETERILRLQPFLADATVRAVPDSSGGVRVEVETVDEIPTVLAMRVRDMLPSALRFGNGNVAGQGLFLAGRVERGFAYRTGFGVEATAHQIFGRPYRLSLEAHRASLGSTLSLSLGRPFLTDLQRTAWHAGFRDVNRYRSFVPPEGDALSLQVERRLWDLGGVQRVGLGRHRGFVGLLLTHETVNPVGSFVIVSDSGLVADTADALGSPPPSYRNLRLNAVAGMRALSFMSVRGFDALRGVQDVATGVQLGTVIGRGISTLDASEDDLFVAADLYAGRGSATSFARLRIEAEGRRDPATGRWDSTVGSGRLAWYVKPSEDHVLIGRAEFGGGWRHRLPFQLLLGDSEGGVRGYRSSRLAGAVRAVLRLEERWSIGGFTHHGTFGLASFIDAGRVWAGDAPFGTDSRMKVGVGVGLLAAFPPESQRLWRLDLAIPVSADRRAGWEIKLSSQSTRSFWREPGDVSRGRAGTTPSTIFTWR